MNKLEFCNKCQREISWGREVRISRGRLITLDNGLNYCWQEEKWYCLTCYNKKRTKKVSDQRKFCFLGELAIALTLIGLVIFLLLRGSKK